MPPVIRTTLVALLALVTVPAVALAAEEAHDDEVTLIMIILIVTVIALLALVAAMEARRGPHRAWIHRSPSAPVRPRGVPAASRLGSGRCAASHPRRCAPCCCGLNRRPACPAPQQHVRDVRERTVSGRQDGGSRLSGRPSAGEDVVIAHAARDAVRVESLQQREGPAA